MILARSESDGFFELLVNLLRCELPELEVSKGLSIISVRSASNSEIKLIFLGN